MQFLCSTPKGQKFSGTEIVLCLSFFSTWKFGLPFEKDCLVSNDL